MDQSEHVTAIEAELVWISQVIEARLKAFFSGQDLSDLPDSPTHPKASALGTVLHTLNLDLPARLMLALCLAPPFNPALLDPFLVQNPKLDRRFSQFGGVVDPQGSGFLPTGETVMFLFAGNDLQRRAQGLAGLLQANPLIEQSLVERRSRGEGLGPLNDMLALSETFVQQLALGTPARPRFGADFPANRLSTSLTMDDLVLPPDIRHQVDHVTAWLDNKEKILGDWGLGDQFGDGFRVLFYGPPGTGKTLTATLLGQQSGLDVYRIDLSMLVSKYIGETEKNLATIFDRAAQHNWILFFDEADALFGKRSDVSVSNDRYANQQVSYLLQRLENHSGLIILASNLRGNIDNAFSRRFQMMIGFKRPAKAERVRLWNTLTSADVPLSDDIDIAQLADHELLGGEMANALHIAALSALKRDSDKITQSDLTAAIKQAMTHRIPT